MFALANLKTEHPGGWADVIKFMMDQKMVVAVWRNIPEFKKDIEVNQSGSKTTTTTVARSNYVKSEIPASTLMDEVDAVSGIFVGDILHTLIEEHWYAPGDKEWLIACKDWKRRTYTR
jgi:hypothetical protein